MPVATNVSEDLDKTDSILCLHEHPASPTEARAVGIETVYQDLALVEDLTVWQNMYLNRELKRGIGPVRWLDRRRRRRRRGLIGR